MSAHDERRRLERRVARGDVAAKARLKAADKAAKSTPLLFDFPSGAEEAGRRRATTLSSADSFAAEELVMYADNEHDLHELQREVAKNMIRRWLKGGGYDPVLGAKGWGYIADLAAQRYTREFGAVRLASRTSFGDFDKKTRELASWILSTRFEDQARAGEWDELARTLAPKRPRRPRANVGDDARRLERRAARGDESAMRRLEEERLSRLAARQEAAMRRIQETLRRANERHDLGLSLGYIGNLDRGHDDRMWSVFSEVPLVATGNDASFGTHSTDGLESLADLVDSPRFSAWVERIAPLAHLKRRNFRIRARGLPTSMWGMLERDLRRLGASIGSYGAGEWSFSMRQTTVEQLREALSRYRTEIEVADASQHGMADPWWPGMNQGPAY